MQVSLGEDFQGLKVESEKAMNIAMGVTRVIADKAEKAIDTIEDEVRPNEMEIEFSIKLNLEGGAVVPLIA